LSFHNVGFIASWFRFSFSLVRLEFIQVLLILVFRIERATAPQMRLWSFAAMHQTSRLWREIGCVCLWRAIFRIRFSFILLIFQSLLGLSECWWFFQLSKCCFLMFHCSLLAALSSLILKCSLSSSSTIWSGLGTLGDSINCCCQVFGWP